MNIALVQHIQGRLRQRVSTPDTSFAFLIDGEWYGIVVRSGVPGVVVGAIAVADVTFTVSDATLRGILDGTLDPVKEYLGGRVKIQGSIAVAQRLREIVVPT